MHIQNHIAVVGNNAFTINRVAAELYDFACDIAARHRNHFNRERESAEERHELGFVRNAHEFLRGRRNNLLASQRSAAALDKLQVVVGLVCAVDVNPKRPSGIKIDNGNPKRLQAPRTLLRARDSRGDVVLDVV